MKPTVEQIIEHFGLEALPEEGGLFIQNYRSPLLLQHQHLPERYSENKPAGTAIYYLLTDHPDSFSALHKLPTDEVYHFYLGDPVEMLLLHPDKSGEVITLGPDILNGQYVQLVARAGVWQGSRVRAGGRYALLGTTMAPGFTESDFTPGLPDRLIGDYPDYAKWIIQLTRD